MFQKADQKPQRATEALREADAFHGCPSDSTEADRDP